MTAAVASSFDEAGLDWGPLEQFARVAQRHHLSLVAGDCMWMGVVELANGAEADLASTSTPAAICVSTVPAMRTAF